MWPNLITSTLHLSKITKFMSPLVRGLRETASGRTETKKQDTTEEFAVQGPGQLCSFKCPRERGVGPKAISKISEINEKGYVGTLWAISICTGQGLN